MSLIGYNNFADQIVVKINNILASVEPYGGFGVRGARRSGRSSVFAKVAEQLREQGGVNCFTGELSEATKEGFEATLLQAISSSALCQSEYDSFQGRVQSPGGFFELCVALNQNEGKPPVFLIDMGEALERAYDDHGMDGVKDFNRLLRQIYNLLKDRVIKLILGIGFTTKFSEEVKESSADVYFDRYASEINLTNTYFDDNSSESFRDIVSSISGVKIPDTFSGLWRGKTITAGQLGENLTAQNVTEINSEILWENLRGRWNMLETTDHENISHADLGELLLADAVIPDERYRDGLEECEEGYRATDALYEQFGFVSPQKDPSKKERIQRRVNDPHDDKVAEDILTGLRNYMCEIEGLSELGPSEGLGQKSAVIEVQVDGYPDLDLNDVDRELSLSAFPQKLLAICVLTEHSADDALMQRIEECADKQGFLLILIKDGIDFGKMPLSRFLRERKRDFPHFLSVIDSEQQIAGLLAEEEDSSLGEDVLSWILGAVQNRLEVFPALSISHQTSKKLVSIAIAGGITNIAEFSQTHNMQTKEAKSYLNLLGDPNVLTVKKDQFSWDPENDVILKALIEHQNDEDKLEEQIRSHYTVSQIDIQNLVDLYQGITNDEGLEGLTEDRIIEHATELQKFNLEIINKKLEQEADLDADFSEKYQQYCDRQLTDLADVHPFMTDIFSLNDEIDEQIEEINTQREKNKRDLDKKKESIKNKLSDNEKYFKDEEREAFEQAIDKVRVLNSKVLTDIEKKIKVRVDSVEDINKRVASCRNRLDLLGDFLKEEGSSEIASQLGSIHNSVVSLELEEVAEEVSGVESKLKQIEEKKDQLSVLTGGGTPPPGVIILPPPIGPVVKDPPPPIGPVVKDPPPPIGPVVKDPPPPIGPVVKDPPPPIGPVVKDPGPPPPQQFNLSDPEQRKRLVEVLIDGKGTGSISKIEVNTGE